MKIVVSTINLMLIVLCAISQSYSNPGKLSVAEEEQIRNIIQSGRDQIVKEIISGNHHAALNSLEQLQKNYGDQYVVLYPREEYIFALSTRKFSMFANRALYYGPALNSGKKKLVFKDFRGELYTYLLPEIMQISQELEDSGLPEQDKEIIKIYILFLFSDDISALNSEIRKFQQNHSRKLYSAFLNSLKRITLNSQINFSIGYSNESIGGKITDSFHNQLNTMKIELDGFIRETYFSLFIGGGFGNKSGSYSFKKENDEIIEIGGKKISSQKYGFKLGRTVYSSPKIKLYPYLSIGGQELSPVSFLYDATDAIPNDILKMTSLFAGAGASCDILVKKWKPKQMYDPEGYFFIRPNIGYDRLLTSRDISKPNNFYFSISFGVGIGVKQ